MADMSLSTSERWIYYNFNRVSSSIKVWRTALDNIGLQHLELPEINMSIMECVVVLDADTLDGKEDELEQQMANKVEQNEIQHLTVTVYDGVKSDGTLRCVYCKEY